MWRFMREAARFINRARQFSRSGNAVANLARRREDEILLGRVTSLSLESLSLRGASQLSLSSILVALASMAGTSTPDTCAISVIETPRSMRTIMASLMSPTV
jgi:hypothetical protein